MKAELWGLCRDSVGVIGGWGRVWETGSWEIEGWKRGGRGEGVKGYGREEWVVGGTGLDTR